MTPASPPDKSFINRDTAERQLTNRLSVEALRAALVQSGEDNASGDAPQLITFRVMHQLATGKYDGDAQTLLDRIVGDFNTRRQFRGILDTVALARQGQQAAAASLERGGMTLRPGPAFDLVMSASSREDGILYLQVKFHRHPGSAPAAAAEPDTEQPTMLFAERDGHFTMVKLPEMMDDTIQIMLDQSHDMVQAVRDPETEFFIR
jgi:hypothetical protein